MRYLAAAIVCGFLCAAQPAAAQFGPSGPTFLTIPGTEFSGAVRGTETAYDSRNNTYLVVAAAGPVKGRIVKPDGSFLTLPFQIDTGTGYAQFPAVAFSPDADSGRGAYLVTWHSPVAVGNLLPNRVHFRLVSTSGTLLGSEGYIGTEPTWWEAAPNVAYGAGSQMFMITWASSPSAGNFQVRAARVNNAGQAVDAAGTAGLLVSTSGIERDPSIAYNPETDKFLIVYRDFIGQAHSRLVSSATGDFGAIQVLGLATSVNITGVTFSTAAHQYLAAWNQNPGGTTGRLVNADGTPSGNPIPLSSRFGSYDSLGIAANPVTGTALAVGQDAISYENGGVEIAANGLPGASSVLTNTGNTTGNFYPVTASSTAEGKWILTTAYGFNRMLAQFAASSASTVVTAPVVTQNPLSASVGSGAVVTWTVAASGSPLPAVQWQVKAPGAPDFSNIPGANATSFGVLAHRVDSGKLYRAVFSNSAGTAISTAALLMVAPPAPNDMDGDGRSDVLVWRPSTGTWYWGTSSLTNVTGPPSITWGNQSLGDVSLTGDLDGDGIADIVIWRPGSGTWLWLTSSTGYNTNLYGTAIFGTGAFGDIPMLADMDGDGLSDLVIWRPTTGDWTWLTSSSGFSFAAQGEKKWGTMGDIPLTGDFDGDGKADLAIWRPIEGMWYLLTSSSGYDYAAQTLKWWGAGSLGDKPFVADFDGDHLADFAVWRASTGTWYWLTSSTGYTFATARGVQWGLASLGDIPIVQDFDGDGRADIAVWRATTGVWYWLPSSAGYSYAGARAQLFGGPGDIPISR